MMGEHQPMDSKTLDREAFSHSPQKKKPFLFLIIVFTTVTLVTMVFLTFGGKEKIEEKRPRFAENSSHSKLEKSTLDQPAPPVTEKPEAVSSPPPPVEAEIEENPDQALLAAIEKSPIKGASSLASYTPPPENVPTSSFNGASGELNGGPKTGLAAKLEATPTDSVKASKLKNLNMLIPEGTQIPCILNTALSSDLPGMTSCIIKNDVLSASGKVVLLDKGSVVTGEYQGGMEHGQNRIFVLWRRARTPNGVVISLNSPAADSLGRSGFSGEVDSKFLTRFGSGLLLSLVEDGVNIGGQILGNLTQKRGTNNNNQGLSLNMSGVQGAIKKGSEIAFEATAHVKPTLYKNQGELVSVFVARDLDFSTVYRLRVVEPRKTIIERGRTGYMGRNGR